MIDNLRTRNKKLIFIDFLRLPRLRQLAESEEPTTRSGGARRSQNQFTPLRAGVNKLIFKRFWILYLWLRVGSLDLNPE
jgi:hypothetical protein